VNGLPQLIYFVTKFFGAKDKGANNKEAIEKAAGIYNAPKHLVIIWVTLFAVIIGLVIFRTIFK